MSHAVRRLLSAVAASARSLAVGFLLVCGMLALYIIQPDLLRQVDSKIYDAALALLPSGEPSPVPVIVDIDEPSLRELGQWPWPRYQMARLVTALYADGALAVALDILPAEADRTSPVLLRDNLRRDLGFEVSFEHLPQEFMDNDRLFAEALRRTPIVLGAYLDFSGRASADGGDSLILPRIVEQRPAGALPPREAIMRATCLDLPLPELAKAAPVGFINAAPGVDNVIRVVPLVAETPEGLFPSLSLRTLMLALGTDNLVLRSGPYGLESLRVKDVVIPLSPAGGFWVPFRGPRKTYPYYSAAGILKGTVPAGTFTGKIVFVGSSAPGLLDIRATPLDRYFPGVEVHAATVDAFLSNRSLSVPPWVPAAQTFFIFLTAMCCLLFFRRGPFQALILSGLLLTTYLAGSWLLFTNGVVLSPLYAVLTLGIGGLLMAGRRFWQEEKQKRLLEKSFGRYVAPEIVRQIVRHEGNLLAGQKRETTILFTDIRDFTTISEKLDPEQVVALLNRYFTPMTALIRKNSGTLDKFIGDALMAFWNAPLDIPDHAALGVETALTLQENLIGLNDELEQDFGVRLRMGAGLHTGSVFVGNMGSQELLDYTIIGDSVNMASRLEGLTAVYGAPVVIGGRTREACGDRFAYVRLDTVVVKGKTASLGIYEPMRHAVYEARAEELQIFARAGDLLEGGEAREAAKLFARLKEEYPERLLYQLYLDRCTKWAV